MNRSIFQLLLGHSELDILEGSVGPRPAMGCSNASRHLLIQKPHGSSNTLTLPIKHCEFPPPPTKCSCIGSSGVCHIYILPAAAWCCASQAAVLTPFIRVEESRTHRILLLPAASNQLPRKDGWIANPVLGRASANRVSYCLMLHVLLLVCKRRKGQELTLSSPMALSRSVTENKESPPTQQTWRNEPSHSTYWEESPKAS